MTHTFSKSAFYSFGDIPLAGPLPLIFSQLLSDHMPTRGLHYNYFQNIFFAKVIQKLQFEYQSTKKIS